MLDNLFVPQFNVTLRCNMYEVCKYCYVKRQKMHLPLDIEIGGFEQLLGAFVSLGVDEVILLGGEPTLYPHLENLLAILTKHHIKSRLFTNGIYNTGINDLLCRHHCVETIFFHYDEDYLQSSKAGREKFLGNMEQAFNAGKKIWIRWNINSIHSDKTEVLALAQRFAAGLGYSISVSTPDNDPIPVSNIHEYADVLVELVEAASKKSIDIAPARAMPLCQFNPQQLEFLKKKGNLRGSCIAINDLTINTDLSMQLCSVTHQVAAPAATGAQDLQNKIAHLKRQESDLKASPLMAECSECGFFESGECQGGCYGYKLYGETRKKLSDHK